MKVPMTPFKSQLPTHSPTRTLLPLKLARMETLSFSSSTPTTAARASRWAKPDDPVQTANNAKRVMEESLYFAIV
ncbi:hypothetical protein N7509_002647 [Penicillium cosmopolitanum]|uniref:Uncharacterized protein n=1 Tax=Penicillium cosmopolitanum TaxID=1131564 RepID=A0A9X0BDP2_9EURO|nr:uncharacterized protein N7509_002647 [Penicillium cosmopolitanum]KAJ5408764.1 hypothetical protein N7509_002647 [Penicillium cosmopolitanum]